MDYEFEAGQGVRVKEEHIPHVPKKIKELLKHTNQFTVVEVGINGMYVVDEHNNRVFGLKKRFEPIGIQHEAEEL